ncbi:hypothetical protein FKM82_014100 [Ascaphus truei]
MASENIVICTEIYGTALKSFANARPYLTAECEDVLLLLGRLVLLIFHLCGYVYFYYTTVTLRSCFEVLLSMAEDDLTCDLGLRLNKSIMDSHDILLEFGNNNLQLLVDVIQNGGAWKNPVVVKILSQQPVEPQEVWRWISQEGSCFLQMRIKHLMKSNCIQQAMLLSKLCAESIDVSTDFFFRQSFITCLCTMLPNEDAFKEISKMDGKEILDTICNLESEGHDNTAFILCTTYLTQQLQNEITSCSWELTLFWSKLQRRIDPSLNTFLERCRQFGEIAKTRQHLFFLIKVVHTEAEEAGFPVSIMLCIRALQIQSNETDTTKTSVCKTIACLLPQDLEVRRGCQLTEFLFEPTFDGLNILEELFLQPDQKSDEESTVISNSLRCELLLALKGHWMFDPEFWDWKTLKRHCLKLLGKEPSDAEEENDVEPLPNEPDILDASLGIYEDHNEHPEATPEYINNEFESAKVRKPVGSSERYKRWLQYKFYCVICKREVIEARILHHAKMHLEDGIYTCPVCTKKCKKKELFVTHVMEHMKMPTRHRPKKKPREFKSERISVGNFSARQHKFVLQEEDDDESDSNGYITFGKLQELNLQDRDVYPCPGTSCSRVFKQFKYLSIHLKAEHNNNDENSKHYLDMKNMREKCAFCRRHFITTFHLKQHMRIHFGDLPYMCVSIDCNEQFYSVNELLSHKQLHNDLQYKCELDGCNLVFSDLGLLYHHEAQHFRDASYVCSFPSCKKFYYCKSDLQAHLGTHGSDFERGHDYGAGVFAEQIKKETESQQSPFNDQVHSLANRDLICGNSPTLLQRNVAPNEQTPSVTGGMDCKNSNVSIPGYNEREQSHDSQTCCSSHEMSLESKEHVFDCACKNANNAQIGLEKLHTPQFQQNKIKIEAVDVLNTFTVGNDSENINTDIGSENETSACVTRPIRISDIKEECHETPVSAGFNVSTSEDNLCELLTGLKHLNLKNSKSCIANSSPRVRKATASSSKKCTVPKKVLSQYLIRLALKPYFCELPGCKRAFVTKDALLLHYIKKHHYSKEKALKLNMFQTKFAPFECHICLRAFTRRTHLRIHYKKKHHIGKEKVTCKAPGRKLGNKKRTSRIINERHTNCLKNFQTNETANRQTHERRSPVQEGFHSETYVDSLSDETDAGTGVHTPESHMDDLESREGRGTRRTVAKGKLCYILNKYHKPFHCVHKTCNSSFTSQTGLIRHYRLVHHYNREQLCLEKDKAKTKREYGKCRRIFTCKYKECRKSFICSKALSKHYIDFHNLENEDRELDIFYTVNHLKPQMEDPKYSDETQSSDSEYCCDVDTCSAVFTDHTSYTQHILSVHRKYNLCESRTKRKRETDELEDVRESYINKPRRNTRLLHNRKKINAKKKLLNKELIEFKTREEALQMCAQNVQITQFPCMVHGCSSVVKLESSIVRHYKLTHLLNPSYISNRSPTLIHCVKNFPQIKKVSNSEEELGPKKRDCTQEKKIPKLHLHREIRSTLDRRDDERESPKSNSTGNLSERDALNSSTANNKSVRIGFGESVIRPPVFKNVDDVPKSSEKENVASVTSFQPPCKLESDQGNLQPHPRHSNALCSTKENNQKRTIPKPLDLKTFKPMGFESSFLKFIEESRETDDEFEVEPPKQCKTHNSFEMEGLPFKDTDQKLSSDHEACLPQHKTLHDDNLGGFQPLLCSSVQSAVPMPTLQNLRTILDKALTDCGDLALKQLHYQRPVVVLERSKFAAPLIDLFSSKKTDELCVAIS